MEGEAVDDEGGEQHEGERHKAVEEEQHTDAEEGEADERHHVAARRQRSREGRRLLGEGLFGLGNEVEKAVQAEDDQGQAEDDARDGRQEATAGSGRGFRRGAGEGRGGGLHVGLVCNELDERYIRGRTLRPKIFLSQSVLLAGTGSS